MTEMLDQLILQVVTLKGPSAVVVFLNMLGYALKMVPWIKNRFIPLVNFVVGPLLTPILVKWPQVGDMEPGLRYPELAAWATSVMMGFLLACIAWISHTKFLRKFIDDKIPALSPERTVDRTQTLETHSEAGSETQRVEKQTVEVTTEKV